MQSKSKKLFLSLLKHPLTRRLSPLPSSKPLATSRRPSNGSKAKAVAHDGVLQHNNIHLKVCPEGEATNLRRRHPASAGSTFPRIDRRSLRSQNHARKFAPSPQSQRRIDRTYLHRSLLQKQHRTPRKTV